MKIVIPPVVTMGAHKHQVKMVRSMSLRRGAIGETNSALGEIRIDPNRTDTQKLQTFLHEVVHAGHRIFGSGLKEPTEGQCDAFAESMAQVLTGALGLEFDFSKLPVEEST